MGFVGFGLEMAMVELCVPKVSLPPTPLPLPPTPPPLSPPPLMVFCVCVPLLSFLSTKETAHVKRETKFP